MSTVTTSKIISRGPKQTEALGEQLGAALKGGELILLVSDLGGGKTTFVKGIVKGIGSQEEATSPTFVISKTYSGSKLRLVHSDFYRLGDPKLALLELQDFLNQKGSVVVVEWPDSVSLELPSNKLKINIIKDPTVEDQREFIFNFTAQQDYLKNAIGG